MTRRRVSLWKYLALLATGGTLFQATQLGFTRNGLGGACQPQNFYTNGIATGVDFCYLFDCQNGFFGGAFLPCDQGNPANNLLLDCPTTVTTTSTTQTQTTTQTQGV